MGGLAVGRGVRVGVGQKRADRGQDGPHVVNGTPLVLENCGRKGSTVEADASVVVDVGVEHFGDELDVGWFGGVLLAELELELEQPSVPGRSLWPFYEGGPLIQVAFLWGGVDAFVLLVAQLLEVSDQSLFGRVAHQVLD